MIGYFVGRRLRQRDGQLQRGSARRELKRARAVVKQLDSIGRDVRRNLATHHASVVRFKQRIALMSKDHGDADSLEDLCQEAELVLGPDVRAGFANRTCLRRHSPADESVDDLFGASNRLADGIEQSPGVGRIAANDVFDDVTIQYEFFGCDAACREV